MSDLEGGSPDLTKSDKGGFLGSDIRFFDLQKEGEEISPKFEADFCCQI